MGEEFLQTLNDMHVGRTVGQCLVGVVGLLCMWAYFKFMDKLW